MLFQKNHNYSSDNIVECKWTTDSKAIVFKTGLYNSPRGDLFSVMADGSKTASKITTIYGDFFIIPKGEIDSNPKEGNGFFHSCFAAK